MKYIVTGATGFIGCALATKLLEDGHVVYCIDINIDNLYKKFSKYKSFVPIIADFSKYKSLHKFIKMNQTIEIIIANNIPGLNSVLTDDFYYALCDNNNFLSVKKF